MHDIVKERLLLLLLLLPLLPFLPPFLLLPLKPRLGLRRVPQKIQILHML